MLKKYKNGNRYWYDEEGEFHRENGPACEFANGRRVS